MQTAFLTTGKEMELTDEQKEAVCHREGPMLVLAGAGSGKTRVVTTRIVYLIQNGIKPSQIVGLTFTNKAAGEMKERIRKMLHLDVLISTFHSLGAKILRESAEAFSMTPSFSIYDDEDQEKVIKECIKESGMLLAAGDLKTARAFISRCKNSLTISEEEDPAHIDLFRRYQEKLKAYGAVDFDDLIYLPALLLREHPEVLAAYQARWSYFMIDEYQDTNHAQFELVKLLAGPLENVFAVGDPDQSIYSWRGSTMRNIMQFERDFKNARVIPLEENFRSTKTILEAANSVIENNEERYEKRLWSRLGEGEKISQFVGGDEREEASFVAREINSLSLQGISHDEVGVLYRTNSQSRALEDELLLNSIPYTIIGGISFYQRKEVKDVLSFLKMAESDRDFLAFLRTVNLPKRGIGEASLAKIKEAFEAQQSGIIPFLKQIVSESAALSLPKKQREGLAKYIMAIDGLRERREGAIADLLSFAIHDTGYLEFLKGDEGFEDRQENLNELFAKGLEWDMKGNGTLTTFLEELALKPSSQETEVGGRVRLMTLHNSKGLEFPAVFIVGVEEDLLPHVNSRGSQERLEEERRLFYVGMTRAKEKLFLCRCLFRSIWGQERTQRASRFIREIDPDKLVKAGKKEMPPARAEMVEDEPGETLEGAYRTGDRVIHKDFGVGEIRDVQLGSLGIVYKVYFTQDRSLKSLVAKFAPLKKL